MTARRDRIVLIAALGMVALPASAATVQVEVDGIEPGGGRVRVALCQGGLSEASCARGDDAPASAARAQFTFQDVAPAMTR